MIIQNYMCIFNICKQTEMHLFLLVINEQVFDVYKMKLMIVLHGK